MYKYKNTRVILKRKKNEKLIIVTNKSIANKSTSIKTTKPKKHNWEVKQLYISRDKLAILNLVEHGHGYEMVIYRVVLNLD